VPIWCKQILCLWLASIPKWQLVGKTLTRVYYSMSDDTFSAFPLPKAHHNLIVFLHPPRFPIVLLN
jgi:hypothetical protein